MTRFLVCLVVIGSAGTVHAELKVTDRRDNDGVKLYQLTVTPAVEPTPAFKHRFIKPPHQLKPGNATAFYRRIHAENNMNLPLKRLREEFGFDWDDWCDSDTPLIELPIDDIRKAVDWTRGIVKEGARAGAERRRCDWGLAVEDLRGPEAIEFLLPEFQGMRGMTRAVALHTRLAIAQQRYDDAIDLLRINYRMGRDTAKVPFLVCVLIGIAQTNMTSDNALDLIAASDSPNLYWALSELPDPLVPMRDALRFEMSLGTRIFPLLEDAETVVRVPEEWNRVFSDASRILPGLISGQRSAESQLLVKIGGVGAGVLGYSHAKQRLVDWGYSTDEVGQMAVGQVLAIYSARVYQLRADEIEKHCYTPFDVGRSVAREAEQKLGKAGPFSGDPDREILPIADWLMPAILVGRNAEMRTRREVATLRTIEAVRMHAAETGALPASLEKIACVHVPANPATGAAFDYQLVDGTAVLTLPESDGIQGDARRYEIRLANP